MKTDSALKHISTKFLVAKKILEIPFSLLPAMYYRKFHILFCTILLYGYLSL